MQSEVCFVRDAHGGLVNMSEVLRINIRKQTTLEQSPEPHYGVAVKQRGTNDWVVMQTGTYEECKGLLDRVSDAVSAYDSLEAMFADRSAPPYMDDLDREPGDVVHDDDDSWAHEEHEEPAAEDHESHDDAGDEEPVSHDEPVEEEHDEPVEEEHDEPVEESDDEESDEPVQELLLDED